jgi:hypothetical protein
MKINKINFKEEITKTKTEIFIIMLINIVLGCVYTLIISSDNVPLLIRIICLSYLVFLIYVDYKILKGDKINE